MQLILGKTSYLTSKVTWNVKLTMNCSGRALRISIKNNGYKIVAAAKWSVITEV